MNAAQAQRVIESLRKGIPPDGFVRRFTVGRKSEIKELKLQLKNITTPVLLLKANYGSGKTHLLRFIREEALIQNYAVSIVTLDANSAVRFNRMDQIFGAICRNIEIPNRPEMKGIGFFFDFLVENINQQKENLFWNQLANSGKWDFSEKLDSPALFVALRAWATGNTDAKYLIEDWLYQPSIYHVQRKKLYDSLVCGLRKYFRDPRSDKQFYLDQVFIFNNQEYQQSWAALRDIDSLSRAAGLKGTIILFDEFEALVYFINNLNMVGTWLWYHCNTDHWNTISLKNSAYVLRSQFGPSYIFKAYYLVT